jgi:large subunit ribosomal protein L32
MPVPKRKVSRARKGKRNANKGIRPKGYTSCANCNDPLPGHTACASCGFYKGVKVLITKAERGQKRTELRKAKAARQPQDEQQPSQEQ